MHPNCLLLYVRYIELQQVTLNIYQVCSQSKHVLYTALRRCSGLRGLIFSGQNLVDGEAGFWEQVNNALLDQKQELRYFDLFPYKKWGESDPRTSKKNGAFAMSMLKDSLSKNLQSVMVDFDNVDPIDFDHGSLNHIKPVKTMVLKMTRDYGRISLAPLYSVLANLPQSVLRLSLTMEVSFLKPAELQKEREPMALLKEPLANQALNVRILQVKVTKSYQRTIINDAFRDDLASFIDRFFPRLQKVTLRADHLMASYVLPSNKLRPVIIDALNQVSPISETCERVAKFVRWDLSTIFRNVSSAILVPRNPCQSASFYNDLAHFRLKADGVAESIVLAFDCRSLSAACFEKLQSLVVIPYGQPANTTTI
ncbi:hypothetical protein HDU76_008709, partial [Blyttiomyces sp. JEL0837]